MNEGRKGGRREGWAGLPKRSRGAITAARQEGNHYRGGNFGTDLLNNIIAIIINTDLDLKTGLCRLLERSLHKPEVPHWNRTDMKTFCSVLVRNAKTAAQMVTLRS